MVSFRSFPGSLRCLSFGLCALLTAGAVARAQSAPEGIPTPEPRSRRDSRPAPDAMRARLLAQENQILQERVVALEDATARIGSLERQAARAQHLELEVDRLKAVNISLQESQEARRLALAGSLRDFFETASLVDQVVEVKRLPEGGYLQSQLKLMRVIRDYLRNEGTVGDVTIRDVDRRLAPRELVEVFLPQNALYINAYAMARLRDFTDYPGFSLSLRYLLRSSMLIQEFDIQADPTGAVAKARAFQEQLQVEEARARGLAQGLGRGVQAAPPVPPMPTPGAGGP